MFADIVGDIITPTIQVPIFVLFFFGPVKDPALLRGTLQPGEAPAEGEPDDLQGLPLVPSSPLQIRINSHPP
ncbi:MAG: hypothetical protein ACYDHE_04785 [Candidatus Acidiferrales bacterium]